MNVIVSANSRYMRYLYIMLLSLIESNSNEKITVYIMQRDFTDRDKNIITKLVQSAGKSVIFLFVDEKIFSSFPTTEKFSIETYFRLIMAELLPQDIQKALYLDVDIIVQGSLKEFYEMNVDGYIAAVCQDADHPVLEDNKRELFKRKGDMRYFNAGVMLWNIELLRKEYDFNRFVEATKQLGYQLQYADQEILNYLLYDKVLYCDGNRYNYIVRGEIKASDLQMNDALILHYAGCNPWQNGQKNDLYQIWWKYAKITPFYVELLEEQLWREIGFGTEKEAVMLRDIESREIYEFAFRLKGTGRIKRNLENVEYSIGIYGAGVMAEVLYELLFFDDMWNRVTVVVDQKKMGKFHGIEIQKKTVSAENILWIVTPVYRIQALINELRNCLRNTKSIVSLREWLKHIE